MTSLTKRNNTELVSLDSIANEINEISVQVEHSYHRTAELLHIAREQFEEEDEKGFMEWATSHTSYSRSHVDRHLQVYDRFLARGALNTKNPIPITVLTELSKQDVTKATVAKVLRKFDNVVPPTREEVRQTIRESKPEYQPPVIPYAKPMAERINQSEQYVLIAHKLLDIDQYASAETVRLVAKHWKHKYHPDKGGDTKSFDRIVRAERVMLGKRGEK